MSVEIITYLVYLAISIALTIWVGSHVAQKRPCVSGRCLSR